MISRTDRQITQGVANWMDLEWRDPETPALLAHPESALQYKDHEGTWRIFDPLHNLGNLDWIMAVINDPVLKSVFAATIHNGNDPSENRKALGILDRLDQDAASAADGGGIDYVIDTNVTTKEGCDMILVGAVGIQRTYFVAVNRSIKHWPCSSEDVMRALAHYLQGYTYSLKK